MCAQLKKMIFMNDGQKAAPRVVPHSFCKKLLLLSCRGVARERSLSGGIPTSWIAPTCALLKVNPYFFVRRETMAARALAGLAVHGGSRLIQPARRVMHRQPALLRQITSVSAPLYNKWTIVGSVCLER